MAFLLFAFFYDKVFLIRCTSRTMSSLVEIKPARLPDFKSVVLTTRRHYYWLNNFNVFFSKPPTSLVNFTTQLCNVEVIIIFFKKLVQSGSIKAWLNNATSVIFFFIWVYLTNCNLICFLCRETRWRGCHWWWYG